MELNQGMRRSPRQLRRATAQRSAAPNFSPVCVRRNPGKARKVTAGATAWHVAGGRRFDAQPRRTALSESARRYRKPTILAGFLGPGGMPLPIVTRIDTGMRKVPACQTGRTMPLRLVFDLDQERSARVRTLCRQAGPAAV
ncbi:MAG: hypothetical protein IT514_07465 [Burkholderiales bacterium]|nr:hypothetical protein [Burkholderiales bacterium]